jgi:hypothetical protein
MVYDLRGFPTNEKQPLSVGEFPLSRTHFLRVDTLLKWSELQVPIQTDRIQHILDSHFTFTPGFPRHDVDSVRAMSDVFCD